jgi:hypothetical protein
MTADAELDGWREAWQAQSFVKPALQPMSMGREAGGEMARPHAEFLDRAIRRMRFRFWKRSERVFLDDLRRQPGDEDVQMQGWRKRRRKKIKGGLNL